MAQRKHHGGAFKARVPVEAIAGHKTVNEIASAYEVHPSQVAKWKAEGGQGHVFIIHCWATLLISGYAAL